METSPKWLARDWSGLVRHADGRPARGRISTFGVQGGQHLCRKRTKASIGSRQRPPGLARNLAAGQLTHARERGFLSGGQFLMSLATKRTGTPPPKRCRYSARLSRTGQAMNQQTVERRGLKEPPTVSVNGGESGLGAQDQGFVDLDVQTLDQV